MNWTEEIDQTTHTIQTLFGHLNSEQLNWKAKPDSWSIAQNMEHLIVINSTYFPVFDDLKAGNHQPPFMAKIGFLVSFIGKFILKSVEPERKRKMKTFPIWEPSHSQISGDVVERFVAHQTVLKEQITSLHPLIGKGTIISSPANKQIVYKLETAFDIIVTHEKRHVNQAKEVVERLHLST